MPDVTDEGEQGGGGEQADAGDGEEVGGVGRDAAAQGDGADDASSTLVLRRLSPVLGGPGPRTAGRHTAVYAGGFVRTLLLAGLVLIGANRQLVRAEEAAVAPDVFIKQSVNGLSVQVSAHAATWHLDAAEHWSADQDTGRLVFDLPKGRVASAPMQIVGTYDSKKGTFLWGWDHPSVDPALRKHAELARRWGQKHGVAEYTTRLVSCSLETAWEFTAVAARLGKANGGYRGSLGTTYVFMTHGPITLEKP